MPGDKSYAQILRSSTIMGAAAGLNVMLGLARLKLAALILGAVGLGLVTSFTYLQSIVLAIVGLGVQSSAVREIASVSTAADQRSLSDVVATLRRLCWLTGLIGMVCTIALSPVLSQLAFGSRDYQLDVAALGPVILLATLAGGKTAVLQGLRRVVDLARLTVLNAIAGVGAAAFFYSTLDSRGVVPTILVTAAFQFAGAWYLVRKFSIPPSDLSWLKTMKAAGGMVKLGSVMMWSGLLSSGVTFVTVTLISLHFGLQDVGFFGAAFALSGALVNFVLSAMATDFYPRLTAAANDKVMMNRLVNEQTEIGVLLIIPGLVGVVSLAPWLITLFYTDEFSPAVELLRWFILGCFGRVLAWPLGFVMLALGRSGWFFAIETSFNVFHVALVIGGLKIIGLVGASIAFCIAYLAYALGIFLVVRRMTDFVWSVACLRMIVVAGVTLLGLMVAVSALPTTSVAFGIAASAVAGVISLLGLRSRICVESSLEKLVDKVPLLSKLRKL